MSLADYYRSQINRKVDVEKNKRLLSQYCDNKLKNPPPPLQETDLQKIKRLCAYLWGAPAKIKYFEDFLERASHEDKIKYPKRGSLCWEAILRQIVRERVRKAHTANLMGTEYEAEYSVWVSNLLGWKSDYVSAVCPDLGKVLQYCFLKSIDLMK